MGLALSGAEALRTPTRPQQWELSILQVSGDLGPQQPPPSAPTPPQAFSAAENTIQMQGM